MVCYEYIKFRNVIGKGMDEENASKKTLLMSPSDSKRDVAATLLPQEQARMLTSSAQVSRSWPGSREVSSGPGPGLAAVILYPYTSKQ